MARARPGRTCLAALVCVPLGLAAACSTQRWVAPLDPPRRGAFPEAAPEPSFQQAVVVRQSDPVVVRRAGASDGFALAFWRRRERLEPGGTVWVGAGGRAEILWPGDASSVKLFEGGAVVIGDPTRDEPLVRFEDLVDAVLVLTPEDRVVLPGGAELRGDSVQPSGPFFLTRVGEGLVRVTNQAKRSALLSYRDERLELAPSSAVDVPVLAAGTRPRSEDPGRVRLTLAGIELHVLGEVAPIGPEDAPGRAHLQAGTASEIEALGVRVRLAPGEEALFRLPGAGPIPREGAGPVPPRADTGAGGGV
jgi:hypothetical protein